MFKQILFIVLSFVLCIAPPQFLQVAYAAVMSPTYKIAYAEESTPARTDEVFYPTLTWTEPLAEYGEYLGNTTTGSASNAGWRVIIYTDIDGNTKYASPYEPSCIVLKPGTGVTLRLISGSFIRGTQSHVMWCIDNNYQTYHGYGPAYDLLSTTYVPPFSGTLYKYNDGHNENTGDYSWTVEYKAKY